MNSLTVFFFIFFFLPSPAMATGPACLEIFAKPELSPEDFARQTNERRRAEVKTAARVQPLRVATWNLNLFHFSLNFKGHKLWSLSTAGYEERAQQMAGWMTKYLGGEKAPDVLFLQEVWTMEDHLTLSAAARESGYMAMFPATSASSAHGLQILVKSSLLSGLQTASLEPFDVGSGKAFERLGKVERGLMSVKIILPTGFKILLGNVHLTPFANNIESRRRQIESLIAILKEQSQDVDAVLIGGDFNIAADFSTPRNYFQKLLEDGRGLYDYFAHALGAVDTYRAVTPKDIPGYTHNLDFQSIIPFAFGRPEQRIDYIWSIESSARARVAVEEGNLLFQNKLNEEGEPDPDGLYPSDHFLYEAVLQLFFAL